MSSLSDLEHWRRAMVDAGNGQGSLHHGVSHRLLKGHRVERFQSRDNFAKHILPLIAARSLVGLHGERVVIAFLAKSSLFQCGVLPIRLANVQAASHIAHLDER